MKKIALVSIFILLLSLILFPFIKVYAVDTYNLKTLLPYYLFIWPVFYIIVAYFISYIVSHINELKYLGVIKMVYRLIVCILGPIWLFSALLIFISVFWSIDLPLHDNLVWLKIYSHKILFMILGVSIYLWVNEKEERWFQWVIIPIHQQNIMLYF